MLTSYDITPSSNIAQRENMHIPRLICSDTSVTGAPGIIVMQHKVYKTCGEGNEGVCVCVIHTWFRRTRDRC